MTNLSKPTIYRIEKARHSATLVSLAHALEGASASGGGEAIDEQTESHRY